MSVDGGAISPKRSAMRHAADCAFHLALAARSASEIDRLTGDRTGGRAKQIKDLAMRLRAEARKLEQELVR